MRRLYRAGVDDVELAVVLQAQLDRFTHLVAPLRRIFFRQIDGAISRLQSALRLLVGEFAIAAVVGLPAPRIAADPIAEVSYREKIRTRMRLRLSFDLPFEIAFDHPAILLEKRLIGNAGVLSRFG